MSSEKAKVKIGVFGAGRGETMIEYCRKANDAELVAVCDMNPVFAGRIKEKLTDEEAEKISFYTEFETFIASAAESGMQAVVLANFAVEHAPYAIKCLEAGLHVFSEVLPCQNMKEAVELVEAVEKASEKGVKYFYAENYCYMPAPRKIRKLYREGKLGEFEYAEGEYFHNCESIWHQITQGNPEHWRNNISAFFYCTHSIGPLIHISGMKPVKVSGFELPYNARMARCGAKAGHSAIEMITLENGAVIKSGHGLGISRNSVWYSVYGSMGRCESSREDSGWGVDKLYVNLDEFEGENAWRPEECFPQEQEPEDIRKAAEQYGHGASDFYTMYNFVKMINGEPDAEVIDVYEALDMFLPGIFAYRSAMQGGIPMDIPDLRDKSVRDAFRNDTECTIPKAAGDMLIPSYSKGNPDVPDSVYEAVAEKWQKEISE